MTSTASSSQLPIIVADCGSTKCAWALASTDTGNIMMTTETAGFNLAVSCDDDIMQSVSRMRCEFDAPRVGGIYFYGAGVLGGKRSAEFKHLLRREFPTSPLTDDDITVESDLLGACRALFGTDSGIACILGTGSNACLYLNGVIVENPAPMGFILGDEGSGASLGKRLVNAIFKGLLPADVTDAFLSETGLTKGDVIERVYRQPAANRFLASLSPFIKKHIGNQAIAMLVNDEFESFFFHNIRLEWGSLPVGFVGSIALHFEPQLRQVASSLGFSISAILPSPLTAITRYHLGQKC